jgi:hypothetical protein
MNTPQTNAKELQEHMKGTYHNLRLGIGLAGAALPWLLWLGGRIFDREPLRGSMSAYYYSPTMRDWFVGSLVAIGLFLVLYKGFSKQEDWALNVAGLFAIGIAFVPTTDPAIAQVSGASGLTLHSTLAVLFFAGIAYVAVFRGPDTLSLIRDHGRAERYQSIYRVLGVGMLGSPLIAVVLSFTLQRPGSLIFLFEAVAVLLFAFYWIVKSRELKETDAQGLALEGKLRTSVPYSGPDATPGRIVMDQSAIELG